MSPPEKLARLERLARLREPGPSPSGPSRAVQAVFLLALFPLAGLWAYEAIMAPNGELALSRWVMFSVSLALSAQVAGELLYSRQSVLGRLLRVLARLVLLPAMLALFLVYWYSDLGVTGLLVATVILLCLIFLVWVVARFSGPIRDRRE